MVNKGYVIQQSAEKKAAVPNKTSTTINQTLIKKQELNYW
jgi:hypothetical protein